MEAIDKFFKVTDRGSTISTEVRAGIATFLTMSYIILVNPQILGQAGLPVREVVTSTALTSAISSLLVGLTANLPVGIAPGMGLNAYLVFSQVLGLDVRVEAALACCFTASLLVALLALVRALSLILAVVPNSIKLATVVGMGLLLSFIGLHTAQVVVKDEETLVTLGNLRSAEVVLSVLGLSLISALHYRNVKGSILIGIVATALGYSVVKDTWPTQVVALPSLKFFALDFSAVTALDPDAWSAILAYALVMIFDIGGAMYGLGNLAGLVKEGGVPGAVPTYLSAAAGTALGALTGTTPLIIAAESAVGIKEGGRTGLVAVTVAGCFAVSLLFAPIMQAVPGVATAPVLVLVGAMMMGESGHINWTVMPTAVPAFLTMVIQPFTFSIANGIYAGLLFSLLLFIFTGDFITYFKELLAPSPDPETADSAQPLLQPEVLPGSGSGPAAPRAHTLGRTSSFVHNVTSRIQDIVNAQPTYDLTPELLIGTPRTAHQYGTSVGSSPHGSHHGSVHGAGRYYGYMGTAGPMSLGGGTHGSREGAGHSYLAHSPPSPSHIRHPSRR